MSKVHGVVVRGKERKVFSLVQYKKKQLYFDKHSKDNTGSTRLSRDHNKMTDFGGPPGIRHVFPLKSTDDRSKRREGKSHKTKNERTYSDVGSIRSFKV